MPFFNKCNVFYIIYNNGDYTAWPVWSLDALHLVSS